MPRLSFAIIATLGTLLAAAPAHAGWFPGDAIDGPSPTIREVTGIDLARDGNGGMVFLKEEAGVPHVFLSRHVAGQWGAPERVDFGVETAATDAQVAVADDHRLAVVFVSGGRLYGTVFAGGPPGPLPAPQQLYADSDPLRALTAMSLDMGINGTAYVAFTAPGQGGPDVRVVRLQDVTWEQIGQPLDINPGQPAGDGARRARVAVAADGNAVVVWGEGHPDGRDRVYGRRVTGTQPSVAPQEISLASFEDAPGGAADSPDIDIEDDGSFAWVVWHQAFGGTSRAIARRLVGSLFEPPVAVDMGRPSVNPLIAVNGRGVGFAVAQTQGDGTLVGAPLRNDVFQPGLRVDSLAGATGAAVEVNEKRDVAVAWLRDGQIRARLADDESPFGPETVIARPELGPATSPLISDDRFGDFAVAFTQGGVADRRVVIAEFDRPPGVPVGTTTTNWGRRSRPNFRWRPAIDLWGPLTYKVFVDDVEIGATLGSSFSPVNPVADGVHRWRVTAVDRRGQTTSSRVRNIRVDATAPAGRLRIRGTRKAGKVLQISVSAADSMSGLKYATIDFGDRSPVSYLRRVRHVYRRGTYTVTAKLADRAGNVVRLQTRLRIKK